MTWQIYGVKNDFDESLITSAIVLTGRGFCVILIACEEMENLRRMPLMVRPVSPGAGDLLKEELK